jgi:hypothetical protein
LAAGYAQGRARRESLESCIKGKGYVAKQMTPEQQEIFHKLDKPGRQQALAVLASGGEIGSFVAASQ